MSRTANWPNKEIGKRGTTGETHAMQKRGCTDEMCACMQFPEKLSMREKILMDTNEPS